MNGYSDFNALHSNRHNAEVELIAFDVLAMDGDDLRRLPLSMRKANLQRLLSRRPDGIFISDFEQGEIGPELFRAACNMGLEGPVSKRADSPYRGGRSKGWIKVKNRQHHAFERVTSLRQIETNRHNVRLPRNQSLREPMTVTAKCRPIPEHCRPCDRRAA